MAILTPLATKRRQEQPWMTPQGLEAPQAPQMPQGQPTSPGDAGKLSTGPQTGIFGDILSKLPIPHPPSPPPPTGDLPDIPWGFPLPQPEPPPPSVPSGGSDQASEAQGQVVTNTANANPYAYFQTLIGSLPGTTGSLAGLEPQLNQVGWQLLRNAAGVPGKIKLANGQVIDVLQAAGLGGQGWQWLTGDGGGDAGGGVFDDPATKEWEQLIRQITSMLMNPQPLSYTDSQKELMLTQSLDPLTRQRDAQRQQTLQRLAQRGISPSSGIAQEALAEVDRQFNQLDTQTRAGFATGQINLEDQRRNLNEARALQALQAFTQIPNRADSRLGMAQQSLINPAQLISAYMGQWQQQNQNQQWNQQQQQQFWQQLMAALSGYF